jgi:hypothetical protein
MIIDKSVRVKYNGKYKDVILEYIDNGYIVIPIKYLSSGSSVIINAKCDICGCDRVIKFKDYTANVSRGGIFACSIKCGTEKSKVNCKMMYGVTSTNMLESKKKKTKKTLLSKYGVDHVSKISSVRESKSEKMMNMSDEVSMRMSQFWKQCTDEEIKYINKKRELTNSEKYGVINISQLDEIKSIKNDTSVNNYGGVGFGSFELSMRSSQTMMDKYGVDNPMKLKEFRDSVSQTMMDKYGVDNPMKLKKFRDKMSNTMLNKYGVANIMFDSNVVSDLRNRLYEKYGVKSYFETEEFKNSSAYNPISNECYRYNTEVSKYNGYIGYIGDNISEFCCDNGSDHVYEISSINFHNRLSLNIPLCTVCNPIGDSISLREDQLYKFIVSIYGGEVIQSYRDGLEIDIYLPELKIGFEFNGLYWHSEKYKDKNYHLNKTKHFQDKGIRIIHIWEDDWVYRKDILMSQIQNILGLTDKRIYARKCEVRVVNDRSYIDFLNMNHLQGYVNSSLRIGLFYNGELVSLMTFDRFEGRKKMCDGSWNINRLCSKLNTIVIGAASKLISFFEKEYNPSRIISYSDSDWSRGSVYELIGFNRLNELKPDYMYIDNDQRVHKSRFSLKNIRNEYNSGLTEHEICIDSGVYRIYNTGKVKYEKLLTI